MPRAGCSCWIAIPSRVWRRRMCAPGRFTSGCLRRGTRTDRQRQDRPMATRRQAEVKAALGDKAGEGERLGGGS